MKTCECGEHSTGITIFWVNDLENCCSSTPNGFGVTYTYEEEVPGVWVLDSYNFLSGQAAQNLCCNNSPE